MYENFDIHIGSSADSSYSLSVIRSPVGETDQVAWQTLSEDDPDFSDYMYRLRNLIAKPEDAKVLGRKLHRFLFPSAIQSLFERSLEQVRAEGKKGLRVRLHFSKELVRLHQIPWEYCYDGEQFLALNPTTPLVRYPPTPKAPTYLAKEEKLRILVAIATNPKGFKELDGQKEENWIRAALGTLEDKGRVCLEVIHQAGLETLSSAIVDFQPNIVHFNGHGGLKENGEGALVLQDSQGKAELAGTEDIMVLLRDRGVGLVILSACQTAASSSVSALMGVAPGLVSAGIPAVIGMQFDVWEETAETFMRVLYSRLAARVALDVAVTEARNRLFVTQKDKVFWGIPVLFMRAPNGLLWQLETEGSIQHLEETLPDLGADKDKIHVKHNRELRRLRKFCNNHQLLLFIGPDIDQSISGIPSRQAMADTVTEEESLPAGASWMDITSLLSRAEVIQYLHHMLDAAAQNPQPFHRMLAKIVLDNDLGIVVTMAYDDLLYGAIREESGKVPNRIVVDNHFAAMLPNRPNIIHLFGNSQQLESLILTKDDLANLLAGKDMNRQRLLDTIRQTLASSAVLFIGLDLSDITINFLLNGVHMGRFAQPAFAIWPGLPPIEKQAFLVNNNLTVIDAEPLPYLLLLQES